MTNTKVMSGFMELTPDMQVEFDRIKRIIEESIDSPLIVDLISPRFTVESVLKGSLPRVLPV